MLVRWCSIILVPYRGSITFICAAYSLKVFVFRIFMLLSTNKSPKDAVRKKKTIILYLFYVEDELGFLLQRKNIALGCWRTKYLKYFNF